MKGNNEIKITSENLNAAYAVADENTRKVLDALVGRNDETTAPAGPKPTLSDYTTIRSYEDACMALDISPVLNCPNLCVCEKHAETSEMGEHFSERMELPKHIIAQMKLEVICKALWGGEVKVYPDPAGNRVYWYPWFALYTSDEINGMSDDDRRALLSAAAATGACAGFGCLLATYRSSYSDARGGFRLCLDTEEKAKYFGKQFVELWAEAVAFNFTVGEHLK